MIELVGVAVEVGEDGLQLRDGVLVDVHDARLVGLNHGQRSGGVALVNLTEAVGG